MLGFVINLFYKNIKVMEKYRIKIEEQYNGEKGYIPQICKLETTRSWTWIQTQQPVWYNIIPGDNIFILSKTMSAAYKTEEAAMKIIEDHKNEDIIKEGDKVKSITYKMV